MYDGPALRLVGETGFVDVPTEGERPRGASAAGDTVAVSATGLSTTLYRARGSRVTDLATVPGAGHLSPDGRWYLTLPTEQQRAAAESGGQAGETRAGGTLWRAEGDEVGPLRGVEGQAEAVAWIDDDVVLLVVRPDGDPALQVLYTCEVPDAVCHRVPGVDGTDLDVAWRG